MHSRAGLGFIAGAMVGGALTVGCADLAKQCDPMGRCPPSQGLGQAGALPNTEVKGTAGSAAFSSTTPIAGAGGGAGNVTRAPCDGTCGGATPVCNESTATCVVCTGNGQCAGTPGRPFCDPVSNTCVSCLSALECSQTPNTPHCHPTSKACVACLSNAQCTVATAARCDLATGTCAPCAADSDCSQIAGKSICNAGACVACTVTNEAPCAKNGLEYSCNPRLNECTQTVKRSVPRCGACVADSECQSLAGNMVARCIPMTFGSTSAPRGSYCLETVATGCEQPYGNTLVMTITSGSVSGASVDAYCGIKQELVTCEAISDMQDATNSIRCTNPLTNQPDDTLCGCQRDPLSGQCKDAGKGGLCREINGANRCTIPCDGGSNCRGDYACTAKSAPQYCG